VLAGVKESRHDLGRQSGRRAGSYGVMASGDDVGVEQSQHVGIGDQEIDASAFVEKVTAMAHKYQMRIVGPPRG
jgi:hypothetical protein